MVAARGPAIAVLAAAGGLVAVFSAKLLGGSVEQPTAFAFAGGAISKSAPRAESSQALVELDALPKQFVWDALDYQRPGWTYPHADTRPNGMGTKMRGIRKNWNKPTSHTFKAAVGPRLQHMPGASVAWRKIYRFNQDHYYNPDKGELRGDAAYQFPPPIPDPLVGLKGFSTGNIQKDLCMRKYTDCWTNCNRNRWNTKTMSWYKSECKSECYWERRSCLWRSRPAEERMAKGYAAEQSDMRPLPALMPDGTKVPWKEMPKRN
eukprot:CAMPEP_0177235064 /NCGR_PEP_ID=MMETSP0367-20130122/44727_1 /TAXON_ID=447022 ORGANISM="Scrippsiella hangoei-like, Strain SHHI-4" /NCGR_SAMPLE_ID=MMETSP0367 /ASSEMBLY_ACC=CAM_ASM_000362 /LENGTH=262 /DNA_ID=CAMNT_0018685893 /DNA_START=83 /DNA_END=871 /DNA_ORIENTATION=-